MLDGVSLLVLQFLELAHFRGGVLETLVEFISEIEGEGRGDGGGQESAHEHQGQRIGVAPAHVLAYLVCAIVLIAAAEDKVAPCFGK